MTVAPTMRQGAEALGVDVADPNGMRGLSAAAHAKGSGSYLGRGTGKAAPKEGSLD